MEPMRELARRNREPNSKYNFYRDVNLQPIFVDGITGMHFGAAFAKVEFHTIEGAENEDGELDENGDIERRFHRVTLAMPTRQLMEFCINTLTHLHSMERENQAITSLFDKEREKIINILDQLADDSNAPSE